MGLIYSSKDASTLKSSLSANLSIARTTIRQLNAGSQQLIAAIDGHTLSGAAYNAGKGLFSDLILPTIKRVSSAIVTIQQELNQFSAANSFIASEGYLDEENLNQQLTILQRSKASLENAAHTAGALANIPLPTIAEMLRNQQQDFLRRAESYQRDIVRIQKKLNQLKEFDAKTKRLFTSSLEELELAMQAVLVLNNTTVNRDGSYVLPKGTDKTWFKKIKNSVKKEASSYGIEETVEDFRKGLTPAEFSKESLGKFLEKTEEKILKEGKNIGKPWAAKLRPRSALGTFVKDTFKPRKWMTSKLSSMSNSTSSYIGSISRAGGKALIVAGAYGEFKEFNSEHRNVGRAITYSAVSTSLGYVVGVVGAAAASSVSVYAGAAATGFIATVGAPVVGAVVAGVAISVGVSALYKNSKEFKNAVDTIGDGINDIGKKVKEEIADVGKAFSSSLKSLKGASWWWKRGINT
ncbi:T7SS effector LXG polymorphic toxin [Enterococcus faecium]